MHICASSVCHFLSTRKPYFKKQKPSSASPRNRKGRGAPTPARAKRGQQRTSTHGTKLILCQTLLHVDSLYSLSFFNTQYKVCLSTHLLLITLWNLENPILRNKNPARLRRATIKGEEPHPLPERSEGSSVLLNYRPFFHYVKPFYMFTSSTHYQSLLHSISYVYLPIYWLSLFSN